MIVTNRQLHAAYFFMLPKRSAHGPREHVAPLHFGYCFLYARHCSGGAAVLPLHVWRRCLHRGCCTLSSAFVYCASFSALRFLIFFSCLSVGAWAGNVSPAYLSTYGIPSLFSYLFPTKVLTFSFFWFILFLTNKEGS